MHFYYRRLKNHEFLNFLLAEETINTVSLQYFVIYVGIYDSYCVITRHQNILYK